MSMNWISVKDAVPPDARKVLICYHDPEFRHPSKKIAIGIRKLFRNSKVKWMEICGYERTILQIDDKQDRYIVTHWMPLPELPE